jgi:hypothetical protein
MAVSSRARKPKRIVEDEADYQFSRKSIKEGKPVPLRKVLTELGYLVER